MEEKINKNNNNTKTPPKNGSKKTKSKERNGRKGPNRFQALLSPARVDIGVELPILGLTYLLPVYLPCTNIQDFVLFVFFFGGGLRMADIREVYWYFLGVKKCVTS